MLRRRRRPGFVAAASFSLLAVAAAVGCDRGSGGGRRDGGIDAARPADMSRPPAAATFQYVVDAITLPQTRTEFAVDLNGDGRVENYFGTIVGLLKQQDLDLQANQDSTIRNGRGLTLFSFATADPSLIADADALVRVYTASPATPPDFSGDGFFDIDRLVAESDPLTGALADGTFRSVDPLTLTDPPTVTLRIVLTPTVAVDMPVVGARVRFNPFESQLLEGQLNGALRADDVDTTLIPGLALSLDEFAKSDPCDAQCAQVRQGFDRDGDGTITADEVRENGLVQALLQPDVDLYDAQDQWKPNRENAAPDSLSLGVAFAAVKASFQE